MSKGHVETFVDKLQLRLIIWLIFAGLVLIGSYWGMSTYLDLEDYWIAAGLGATWLVSAFLIGTALGSSIAKPTEYIAKTILHISPNEHLVPPQSLDEVGFGRELAESISRQIFAITSSSAASAPARAPAPATTSASDVPASVMPDTVPISFFDQVPVTVLGISSEGNIAFANVRAKTALKNDSLTGKSLKNTLQFFTQEGTTLDDWLKETSEKNLNDLKLWQKIEIKNAENTSLGYFDVAASYSKHSSTGIDTIFVLFDHSDAYSKEDDSLSFISLAVHELRAPVTIMRGYIEAFADELGPSVTPQLTEDLRRMNVSAEGLSSFITNILNVARINQGQLTLKLQEDDWNKVLPQIVDTLRERAAVHEKTLELRMEPELPMVAVDRMSISEVITNLIDNAIKYSPRGPAKIVIVSKLNKDRQIETSVQDFGIGIPESVMPHLFTKFYRNHRTRSTVGGTGLGLFLSKAIVNAHNGNIWVRSKENEGSTFGFTIMPYIKVDNDHTTDNNEGMIRSSHGWIKNHSLQRR